MAKRDHAKEVQRGLLHAAVNNLFDLSPGHPAFERSLNIVTEFYHTQETRWDAHING